MVDGRLPGVEPTRSDDSEDSHETQPSPEPPPAPRKRRRSAGYTAFGLLKRVWIPLVIVAVVAAGALTVSRLHGIFGTESTLTYGDTRSAETEPANPKILRYEIFGPPGTIAQISFFNGDGDPEFLDEATLPWSLDFPITGAAGIGSIAAQGDSESLGCRILIDGKVESEKVETHEASTFVSCVLKAA